MLFLLLMAILLNPSRLCEGSQICEGPSTCEGPPTFQEEYRGSYVPKAIKTSYGLQVVAPDTPYVAVAGPDQLYFIDTRLDTETAKHAKENLERASAPKEHEYIAIDEISAMAEVKNSVTGETTFVFDPSFARVMFLRGMNRHNPELKLPEPEPAGDWLVTYDLGNSLLGNTTEEEG